MKKSPFNRFDKLLAHLFLVVLFLPGCTKAPKKVHKIGFAQCTSNDLWRQTMNREMERSVMYNEDLALEIKSAQGNSDTQIEQIEDFISQKVDLLIVSPNESKPISPVVEKAYKLGIPVILIDRKIESSSFSSFIGGDNYQIGYKAGDYIGKNYPFETRIIEVWGLEGSSPAIERHKGFIDAINKYPNLAIVATVKGDWLQEIAYKNTKALPPHIKADLVFAHNDVMAIGAKKALDDFNPDIDYIGVDALPGENGGTQMIITKKLNASLIYQTGGKTAIETASKILHKLPYSKFITLPTAVVDTNNAAEIQHQYAITNSYMDDIDKQQHKLNELSKRYYNLKILYLTTFIVLVLIILLSLLTIKAYRKRNFTMHQMEETNKLLQIKNQFIENQSEELYVQKEELANSNTTKDKLISILAHDLRNPFHTIIGFSDLIINDFNQITDEELKEYIELINSSSKKANELLDNILQWSRLQMGRIEMIAQEVFVIDLIKDVLSFSESEIFRKKIDLVLLVSPQIKVKADINMIKTVLRNLISNALKFTPEKGLITIRAEVNTPQTIKISVIDTGVGMTVEQIQNLFIPDQNKSTEGTNKETGTGLGLVICKEFINLHGGEIDVKSETGNGSDFSFSLPWVH